MRTASWAWYVGLVLTSAAASAFVVGLVRRWAAGRLLDVPNQRSSHQRPTPRGGGLGIVLVVLGGLWLLDVTGRVDVPLGIWLGGGALAALGLADDVRSLPAPFRLAVQALVATALVGWAGGWDAVHLPLAGTVHLGWAGQVLAVAWVLGLVNAYNFMDGVDGIAGLQGALAGAGWLVLGSVLGSDWIQASGALLAGASAGFLVHNWAPAQIFMGDVGSVFLGYAFSALAVAGTAAEPRLPLVAVLLVWPFVFDAAFTFLRRAWRRERVLEAHRSHLYQRMHIAGWSHARVSAVYGLLASCGVLLAVASAWRLPGSDLAVAAALPVLCLALWATVVVSERRGAGPAVPLRQHDRLRV
jgi:UDP-N-acetylmuramyl pentapeptide phosphotransferase/UDP-N-acetylglucosamine-1-phosphate transferase